MYYKVMANKDVSTQAEETPVAQVQQLQQQQAQDKGGCKEFHSLVETIQ